MKRGETTKGKTFSSSPLVPSTQTNSTGHEKKERAGFGNSHGKILSTGKEGGVPGRIWGKEEGRTLFDVWH